MVTFVVEFVAKNNNLLGTSGCAKPAALTEILVDSYFWHVDTSLK